MMNRVGLPGLALLLCGIAPLGAAVPAPPPPERYDIVLRYQIDAFRTERVRQYLEMMRFLQQQGFQRDPDEVIADDEAENPRADRLHGTIPSAAAARLVQQRHILTVLLRPDTVALPADPMQPVRVDLEIQGSLSGQLQQQLFREAVQVLAGAQLRTADGFDHRGYTRLVGVMPAGQLNVLLRDLRRSPAAWKLLDRGILSAVRKAPGGAAVLLELLDDWTSLPAGRPLVDALLAQWEAYPTTQRYIETLSPEVVNSEDRAVYKELLVRHLVSDPDSVQLLEKLFENVLAAQAAPQLMDYLIPRLRRVPGLSLPLLFRIDPTVRVARVYPAEAMPLPSVSPPPPPLTPEQQKMDPGMRALVADMQAAARPTRMDLLLRSEPSPEDVRWQSLFAGAQAMPEGRLGSIVSVIAPAAQATTLAQSPLVVGIRFPRVASMLDRPEADPAAARLGRLGLGTRLAIVAADFRGWEELRGKGLPAGTRLIDVTLQSNPLIEPAPHPPGEEQVGAGTRCALAAARVVPRVELTLVRIDPTAPHQLMQVARAVNGEDIRTFSLLQRQNELRSQGELLQKQQEALLVERAAVLGDPSEEEEAVKRREKYFQDQKAFDDARKAHHDRLRRFLEHERDLLGLRQIRAVWNTLAWQDGFPLGGSSDLSRYLDDRPFQHLWLQSAARPSRQAWKALLRDADGNGIIEVSPTSTLLEHLWSPELSFLGWQPAGAPPTLELPAGVLVRISVQWREAQDPDLARIGEDPYVLPQADLHLEVFHQPDPQGQKQPADDLTLVGRSLGQAQRLQRRPNASTYEQTVVFRTPAAGRYAFQVRGRAPVSVEPLDVTPLDASRRVGEVYPQVHVEAIDPRGQAILHDYSTPTASPGMPGDARSAQEDPRGGR